MAASEEGLNGLKASYLGPQTRKAMNMPDGPQPQLDCNLVALSLSQNV